MGGQDGRTGSPDKITRLVLTPPSPTPSPQRERGCLGCRAICETLLVECPGRNLSLAKRRAISIWTRHCPERHAQPEHHSKRLPELFHGSRPQAHSLGAPGAAGRSAADC